MSMSVSCSATSLGGKDKVTLLSKLKDSTEGKAVREGETYYTLYKREAKAEENFQNPSALGTANSWQGFLPVVSNATSFAESACSFSTVSTPAVSTAGVLPSVSGTSYQPLLGSSYPYQQINTGMLSEVSGQNRTFTSAASYSSSIQWDITGSAQVKSSSTGGFTMTITDQDIAVSVMSVVTQYHTTSHTTSTVPLSTYPSLSDRRVKRTHQGPHQSQSLLLPYQEGSQVHYYNQGNLRPLLSEELGNFLQSYDSMSYTGGRGSALQTYNSTPDKVMVLKEVQPTDNLPLASTSGFYNSASAQPITQSRFQVMDSLGTQTSLGWQPASQTFCLTQNPDSSKSSSNKIELYKKKPPELEDSSMIAPVQSNLALYPAPTQDSPENNIDVIKMEDSDSLDSYPNAIANKDPLLCPVKSPDLHQFLSCFDSLDQEKQGLGKSIMCNEDGGPPKSETHSTSSLGDITTWEDIDCPSLFESLQDLDQPNSLQNIDIKVNITHEVQQNPSAMRDPCGPPRKNKTKASKPLESEPQNKIQRKNEDDQLGEEVRVSNSMVVARERSLAMSTHNSQQQKVTPNSRKAKSQGQPETNRARENKTKKVNKTRLTGPKGEAEGKTATAQTKRKRNPPDIRQESLKKPRSSLGHHMLESVQVVHALRKRRDPTPRLSSPKVQGNSNKTKGFQASSVKPRPHGTPEEKGIEKPQIKSKKSSSNVEKTVHLPFMSCRPRERRPRPQTRAARVPVASQPARPGSSTVTEPTAGKSSRPTPSCLADSGRPTEAFSANAPQAALMKPTSPPIDPSETSRPPPVQATFSSLQRDSRIKPVTKGQTLPKSQNKYLLHDFSARRIPWREPTVPEPVMSRPITNEERPKREAMKRKTQGAGACC
ncbi:uncharacterized protein C2orf78-like [Suncus etruscus]|uniref:uncharacterized protein C2orf78-like n=1 Tax=Suncus etruscus TaxID=109475 RepID=UPI00210FB315|nr:uncharacterized protein C2orf78-like [Suncus etruscus]